ncbi:MAG: hypothetical protein OWU33_03960 [Firmicutes bacterium]|nr:hypothetical protein [Bacillota bacterium]
MTRDELEHIIRAAGAILNEDEVIVVGSQAILSLTDADQLPPEVTLSVEADLVPMVDPDERKADLIDGSIGEGSPFHETFHIYAQGVSRATSRLPQGWESRLIPWRTEGTRGVTGWLLDPYDLLIAKYLANRPKDREFCQALGRTRLLDGQILLDRLALTDCTEAERQRVQMLIHHDFLASTADAEK